MDKNTETLTFIVSSSEYSDEYLKDYLEEQNKNGTLDIPKYYLYNIFTNVMYNSELTIEKLKVLLVYYDTPEDEKEKLVEYLRHCVTNNEFFHYDLTIQLFKLLGLFEQVKSLFSFYNQKRRLLNLEKFFAYNSECFKKLNFHLETLDKNFDTLEELDNSAKNIIENYFILFDALNDTVSELHDIVIKNQQIQQSQEHKEHKESVRNYDIEETKECEDCEKLIDTEGDAGGDTGGDTEGDAGGVVEECDISEPEDLEDLEECSECSCNSEEYCSECCSECSCNSDEYCSLCHDEDCEEECCEEECCEEESEYCDECCPECCSECRSECREEELSKKLSEAEVLEPAELTMDREEECCDDCSCDENVCCRNCCDDCNEE
jgi:hypothetical protein